MEPAWVVVRATLDFSDAGTHFQRDEMVTVDASLPGVKRHLASGWFEPLPAAMQPRIEVDEDGEPSLAEEVSDGDPDPPDAPLVAAEPE